MLDCIPQLADICIPAEYQHYWEPRGGPRIRADADKVIRDGPVFIGVEASDALFSEPAAPLATKRLNDFTIYYEIRCESATNCLFRVGARSDQGRAAATRPDLITLRRYWVTARDESDMDAALGKLRICFNFDRCAGPSISLAELRS